MAQVGVQAPSNLMEMYSSPSPMMWDIASQQVNDQTLGNLINRQSAQQSQMINAAKLPYELESMGLSNETSRAQLPGVEADSLLKQDKAVLSRSTLPEQYKTTISKLAKEASENDLVQAENGVRQMMLSPDPRMRQQANQMFGQLYEIKKERDKLAIQNASASGLQRDRFAHEKQMEQMRIDAGKYVKPATMSLAVKLNTLTNPRDIDAALRQILADPNLSESDRGLMEQRLAANKPAYDNMMAQLTAGQAGKPNAAAIAGMEGFTPPQAAPAPQATPTAPAPAEAIDPLKLSPIDMQAYQWAQNNRNDPRAKEIIKRLQTKGK